MVEDERLSATDLSVGAFSANPPWSIDPTQLTWRTGLTAIRSVARRQVPEMIAPHRWPGGRAVRVVRVIGSAGALWWLRERPGRNYTTDDAADRTASRTAISRRMRVADDELSTRLHRLNKMAFDEDVGILRDQQEMMDLDTTPLVNLAADKQVNEVRRVLRRKFAEEAART